MALPLSYGVRTRMAGNRPVPAGRKTFALRRTPSRIGTATLNSLNVAAPSGSTEIAMAMKLRRKERPSIGEPPAPMRDAC